MPNEVKQKLRGLDYLNMPITELANHPDFSQHALRIVCSIGDMTTKELENLDISKTRSTT